MKKRYTKLSTLVKGVCFSTIPVSKPPGSKISFKTHKVAAHDPLHGLQQMPADSLYHLHFCLF